MYPFERFTERAKKVLTLAQQEAERSHHSYIGTEHLLLGLLREGDGLAARVLKNLGVEIGKVREVIESVLGRNERIVIQQIIPTSRVKQVIEISFEEARRMGHNYVGTEHLLLGLLIEGEGIAAHVLEDLKVTVEKARDEIERLLAAGAPADPVPARHMDVPRAPRTGPGTDLENLEALLADARIAELLREAGLDVEKLVETLKTAPETVLDMRESLAALNKELEQAVKVADYRQAAKVQEARDEIAARLHSAEQDWLDALTR